MYRTLIGAVFICLLPSAAYVAEYSGPPLASGTEGTVKIGVPADKTTNNIAPVGARDDGPAIRVAADDDYFTFKVCNKSKYDAQVAISHRVDPSSKDFYVRGWYFVDAGECATIGDYPSGWFYHYAENRDDNYSVLGRRVRPLRELQEVHLDQRRRQLRQGFAEAVRREGHQAGHLHLDA